MNANVGYVRIGELSRRSGVSTEVLRAWERRYGLFQPTRSSGGFRLYSPEDERRLQLMRAHLERGLSAAEAARLTLEGVEEDGSDEAQTLLEAGARDLRAALDAFDEGAAHASLDRLLSEFALETVLADVVLPYLRELGERWAAEAATVAQEHFASQLLRGRLLGVARGWGRGTGPRAVLACAPGEQHDLALIAFGLTLRGRGWRITYLGQDTPVDTLESAVDELHPEAVVLAATTHDRFTRQADELRRLARKTSVWLAGDGASEELARKARSRHLSADPIAGAEIVATSA
jgi:MerR family transcriptional regulator, light-induced transcriptional regulator